MRRPVNKCPVCDGKLEITRLSCEKCDTSIEGTFGRGLFSNLNDEESKFVELFVISRGNIKEMEKRLGISYPTVRNKLNAVISKFTQAIMPDPEVRGKRRLDIIESIKRGDISPEEGAILLEGL